ncbi:MAG TPA: elongation factor G [Acidimicrobiales bacterium]|nr:elongation factor G [Acidimicrobiales bacterium]
MSAIDARVEPSAAERVKRGPSGPNRLEGHPTGIRNVALVGHNGCGKTTLAEALLYATGAINRLGKVDDGSTVSDFEPEEIKYHMSVSLAVAPCKIGDVKLNIIDTPGYADFFGEVRAACSVVDLVVLVVSAVEGIEAQTEEAWALAVEMGLPRLVFINKLDRERANFDRTLTSLRERFGAGIAPLELPVGGESGFRGIADLLTDTAIVYEGGKSRSGPIPDDLAATEHEVREQLVEGIVVGDDDLMERYLEGDTPSTGELEATLASGVAQGVVFPVVCGSAASGVGIDRLASLLAEIGPTPEARPPLEVQAGDSVQEVPCDPAGLPLARVFKTISDPYVGKISLLRVLSGTIRPDSVLTNSRTHSVERLHVLQLLRGKDAEPAEEAGAGDIVAAPKLADVATGDTLAPKGSPVLVPVLAPEPRSLSVAIKPKSKGDEDKLMTGLHRLQEEDPALLVERVDETHQTILWGTGETHLAMAVERLARKFGVEIATEEVLVPYRETITVPAEAVGRYKKQTGGHGQFGVASIRIEPLGRGEGFRFVDQVVGGAIPRQYIPAVEKGIVEAMGHGGVHGYPVVDVQVTCLDGKHHPVDSSEMSFKMAGSLAFKEAMAKAGPVLLEPITHLVVTVPSSVQGHVLGDLNSRRGRVKGTEAVDRDAQRITALVPTAEMQRYAVDLRSLTAGRGRFRSGHDHYDVMPPHLADRMARD